MDRVKEGGKILVGFDGSIGSRAALAEAIKIAKTYNASILVLNAYSDPTEARSDKIMEVVERAEVDQGTRIFRNVEGDLKRECVKYDLRVVREIDPSKAILNTAEKEGFDLIVLGVRGIGGAKPGQIGPVAKRVSAAAKIPVRIV